MTPLPPEFLNRPFAHRGYHNRALGHIENSPSAIRAAIAAGYGIEIDVQLSRDGMAMVFHDESLDRLTDHAGLLADHLAVDLQKIILTDSTDCIPTLAQVLAVIAGQTPLLIEIKDQTGDMSQTDARLEQATAEALSDYSGPVAVMSFNPHCMAHMAQLAPQIARGLTTSAYDYAEWAPLDPAICDQLRDIPDYQRTGSVFISHEASDLDRPRVQALKSHGAHIQCWTIKTKAAEQTARRLADNITFEGFIP
jgi:glycerophosphoryl diester phosphodiesterase